MLSTKDCRAQGIVLVLRKTPWCCSHIESMGHQHPDLVKIRNNQHIRTLIQNAKVLSLRQSPNDPTESVPSPRFQTELPHETEHPPAASFPSPRMQQERPNPLTTSVPTTEIVYEPMPFSINDLTKATKPYLNTRQKAVLQRADSAMARNETETLRLFVDNYREKFEAACLHGEHKRVTRVELARRPKRSTQSLGHGAGICKSWEDFAHLNSVYIDIAALLDLMAKKQSVIRDDEHFLSLLACNGEKQVRLFVHNMGEDSPVATLVPVLDQLMKTSKQSVHTLALPIGYISRGSLKCPPASDVCRYTRLRQSGDSGIHPFPPKSETERPPAH